MEEDTQTPSQDPQPQPTQTFQFQDIQTAETIQGTLPKDVTEVGDGDGSKVAKVPKAPAPPIVRQPGKSLFPLARVQKIMKADNQLPPCAKEAVVLISIATEEFIKRLSTSSHSQAARERRTIVQQRDIVTAVKRQDEFLFLEEIIRDRAPTVAPATAKPPRPPKPKAVPVADTKHYTLGDMFQKRGNYYRPQTMMQTPMVLQRSIPIQNQNQTSQQAEGSSQTQSQNQSQNQSQHDEQPLSQSTSQRTGMDTS